MDKIFFILLNMSFTASFVIVAVSATRLLLRRAPKAYSYALWAVVLFNLVIPFKFKAPVSLNPINAEPIPLDIVYQTTPMIEAGIAAIDNSVNNILPVAASEASINPLQIWAAIGMFLWVAGVVVMLLYAIVTYARLKSKLRFATRVEVDIYETDRIHSPFVLGFMHPRIYLPVGLTEGGLDYILWHERTHIKRRDYLIKPLAYFVLALHWFNPLVWLAYFLLNKDMEMSCDERVLKEMSGTYGDIKEVYSSALLRLATGKRLVGLSPLAFGEGSVKERIKNVLNFRKPSRWIVVIAAALVIVVSAGFAVNRTTGISDNITDNLFINNESGAEIVSIGIHVNNQSHGVSNADNSLIKNGVLLGFKMDEIQDCVFRVEVHDANWNLIAQGEFVKDFTNKNKPVYLYIRDDENGNTYITDLDTNETGRYDLGGLAALHTPYVGNHNAVGKILDALPPLDDVHTQRFFSISDDYGTGRAPYTLTAYYEPNSPGKSAADDVRNIANAPKNAALLFALIDNLEEVSFAFRTTQSGSVLDKTAYTSSVSFNKDEIAKYLLDNVNLSFESFKNDWNGSVGKLYQASPPFSFGVSAEPEKYMLAMSGYPGIYLFTSGHAPGEASVQYECQSGRFGTLKDSVITFLGSFTTRDFGSSPAVFWSPDASTQEGDVVTVRLMKGADAELSAVRFSVRLSGDALSRYSLVDY